MTTQRRTPSGQGPSRRPGSGASRSRATGAARSTEPARNAKAVRTTGAVRNTGSARIQPRRAARPALNRRTANASPGPAKRMAAPRPRALTGRATVLIVVFVALALAYTYPLRVYLAQESQIAQLRADQAAERQQIQQKSEELAKWQDPAYIEAQARGKEFYVRPGDTPLRVIIDPAGAAKDDGTKPPAPAPGAWYDTLWGSVRAADAESPN